MDLGNPWALLSGIMIGLVGMAVFIRGKKEGQVSGLVGGAALCIYPYFVTDMLLMWSLFALCITGIWWLKRFD
jgi:hypothetical protein